MRETFGPYQLRRKIGEGGFGVVWEAWDPRLQRRVALKILTVDDPLEVARFAREARTTAGLSHPNIAAVYEVGTVDDRHFIAMQYVDGGTLEEIGLSPREAMAAARDAARALAVAHDRGVIHRDLKPANLMRDESGRIYVLDFGLAKSFAAEPALSMTGELMGTPAYMSPEQARGARATARSDVYGLGATLYRLLTGRRPFEGATVYDLLRQVIEDDPIPPRRLNSALDRDGETVVLTAMAKDPARRYAAATALADDIDRWLAGDTIRARPATWLYRTSVRVRKRPLPFALAALLLAALVAGGVQMERRNAETAELRELDARMQSVRDRIRAAEELDREDRFDAETWTALLNEAERDCAAGVALRPGYAAAWYEWGRALAVRRDWNGAIARFDEAIRADPKYAQARYARAIARVERIFQLEHDIGAAFRSDPTALGWVRDALDDLSGSGSLERRERDRADLLDLYLHERWEDLDARVAGREDEWTKRLLAESFHRRSRGSEARRAADLYEAIVALHPASPWVLSRLSHMAADAGQNERAIREATRALTFRGDLVEALVARGEALTHLDRTSEALADFDEAIRLRPDSATALIGRSRLQTERGDFAAGAADADRAIALQPTWPQPWVNRGIARYFAGDCPAAIADYDQALALDPNDARTFNNRALAYVGSKSNERAMGDFAAALRLDPAYVDALVNRAAWLGEIGRFKEAHADLDAALSLDPRCAKAHESRGKIRLNAGDPRGAVADFDEAIHLAPDRHSAWNNRGAAKMGLQDYPGAVADFDEALRLHPHYAEALYNRGAVGVLTDDLESAERDLRRAVELKPDHAQAHYGLGAIHLSRSEWDRAFEEHSQAILHNNRYAEAYLGRGDALRLRGDRDGAAADYRRALEVAPPGWPHRALVESALRELGQ